MALKTRPLKTAGSAFLAETGQSQNAAQIARPLKSAAPEPNASSSLSWPEIERANSDAREKRRVVALAG
jgi:hypothetical protein